MEINVQKGTINYEIIGAGFPLLFLHAMGTDHRSMLAWAEPIFQKQKGYQRIYVDLPAHGLSNIKPSLKCSDDMLDNLLQFVDEILQGKEFALVGHSFGGYLAQGLMHHRFGQVRGISLIAPALHVRTRNLPQKVVLQRSERILESLESDIRLAFETLMVYQTEEMLSSFLDEIQPGRLLANREFLSSNWRDEGYFLKEKPFEGRNEVTVPSLILAGKQDAICGYKDYVPLIDLFEKATFTVLDGAGHLMTIEKREQVQMMIVDWLERMKTGNY